MYINPQARRYGLKPATGNDKEFGEYVTADGKKLIWKSGRGKKGAKWSAYGHDAGPNSMIAREFDTLREAAEYATGRSIPATQRSRRRYGRRFPHAVIAALCLLFPASALAGGNTSCFGPGLYDNNTANGRPLNPDTVGIAHKTLPLNSYLFVKYGRKTFKLKIIDRGPYAKGRIIDLTEAAAKKFGFSNCDAWGHRDTKSWRP